MAITGAQEPEPAHARWFRSRAREINDEYARLHRAALQDPQRAGHGGEATWVGVLKQWLPRAYEVVTRRYIVPEIGAETFETDIIVLSPSYPAPLRVHEEILTGGVAAAFSVKLTLDSAGIRDGVKRAVALRRAMGWRVGTPRDEMVAPFPVGILAHSHGWKAPGSTPENNIANQLWSLDQELARHPRESLDYLCVSDLAMWSTIRFPYAPSDGLASTAFCRATSQTFDAIASLMTHLLVRLSYFDSTLRPLAYSLMRTGALGSLDGPQRNWNLDSVFSDEVRAQLPSRGGEQIGNDWIGPFL